MAAFSFPDPPVENGTEVTNETTGVTYKYHLESDRWVVVTTNLATDIDSQISTLSGEVSRLDGEIEIALSERDELIEGAKGINDQQSNKIDALEKADDDLAQLIAFETSARQQGDAALQEAINGIEPEVDLSNYYTKAEIDNQFSLRGTGAIYLLSSFSGTPTIRQGEFNVNSRLAGQVTFISIAPFDDQGKRRRNVVAGDTIELYTTLTQNYYRYEVTRVIDGNYEVTYVGNVELRDDTFGSGWPFTIWLYPTPHQPRKLLYKSRDRPNGKCILCKRRSRSE